jgi:threonylcarbamoyladenosine tRNA methylthiotransferase MtaB
VTCFVITTLGCKVNQYESDGIAAELTEVGWQRMDRGPGADVVIVNTCAVTSRAAMQSRQAVRCLIRYVLGTRSKTRIAQTLIASMPGGSAPALPPVLNFPEPEPLEVRTFPSFRPAVAGGMTRAYLKIQDGCDAFCSYCIVPFARGRSSSMPVPEVMEHLERLGAMGFTEVILTGIHLGAYGRDLTPPATLAGLLGRIVRGRPVHRIRLSSIEPGELTDEILDLAAGSTMVCDHFHIPLQSGDDEVLLRMKRPYTTRLFMDLALKVRRRFPLAALGMDIMMGFPGETRHSFERSLAFVSALPVTHLHVFPYSPRPGTLAWNLPDRVDSDAARQRCKAIREVGDLKRRAFEEANQGRVREAVIQRARDRATGLPQAVTSNYLTLLVRGSDPGPGTVVPVRIDGPGPDGRLLGTLVRNDS